ncbi:hypothetical protein Tco_1484674, partial [Tanacetum coccineum]
SSVCGPSASLPGRSFHANPNAVMITSQLDCVDSQNSYPISRDGGNTQENCQIRSTIGVSNNGFSASRRCRNVQVRPRLNSVVGVQSTSRRTGRRVLTSGSTFDTNSVNSYAAPREPPKYIKSLFENKHFMENIRAYNQMFAMTSFGAKIDEYINAGRGSYVFKVSGQIYHWIGSLCPPAGEPPRFLQLYIYDTNNEVQNRMYHFGGIDNSQLEPGIVEGLIHFLDAHNELVQLFRTTRDKCRELDIPEFKIRLYNAEGARGYELSISNTLGAMVFENESAGLRVLNSAAVACYSGAIARGVASTLRNRPRRRL